MKPLIPPIAFVDADVLIALDDGGILVKLFKMPFQAMTTDFIAGECQTMNLSDLVRRGLKIKKLTGAQIKMLQAIRAQHRGLSVPDISLILKAKENNALMLSNDGALKRLARSMGLECHGADWLLDQMIQMGLARKERRKYILIKMGRQDAE